MAEFLVAILWFSIAVNAALTAWHTWQSILARRAFRILTQMAVTSLINDRMPLWIAYYGRLGEFEVSISVRPPRLRASSAATDQR